MTKMGPVRKHFWLTIGVAKAVSVDLGAAIDSGALTPEDYADMVTRCRSCPQPDRCRADLARSAIDAPPSYCRNIAVLEELAPIGVR